MSSKGAGGVAAVGKGSSFRELNNAVFDAMTSGRAQTVRVGMGSRTYGFVGRWFPRGLVGWMMGVRKVGENKGEFGRGFFGESLSGGSKSTSPGSASTGNVHSLGDSEYVSVYQDEELDPDALDALPDREYPDGFREERE